MLDSAGKCPVCARLPDGEQAAGAGEGVEHELTRSFFDRMASTMVLALGLLHGQTVADDSDVFVVTLKVVTALVVLYAVQHYSISYAAKGAAYARAWWHNLYQVTALMQSYFASIVMFVLSANFSSGVVRGSFNLSEIARLFLLAAVLVVVGDVATGAISGAMPFPPAPPRPRPRAPDVEHARGVT